MGIVLSAKSMLLNPDRVEDARAGKAPTLYKAEDANRADTKTLLP